MRRVLLTSLILLPVMAHAQAPRTAEAKPFTSAELAVPAIPAPAVSPALAVTPSRSAVPGLIHIQTIDDFASTQAFDPIHRGQLFGPDLKTASTLDLTPQDLQKQPAVTKVVLDATVDANGVPHDISVSHSGGAVIDQKALAAVSQYRFQPAVSGHSPTESRVSITIKIQK